MMTIIDHSLILYIDYPECIDCCHYFGCVPLGSLIEVFQKHGHFTRQYVFIYRPLNSHMNR